MKEILASLSPFVSFAVVTFTLLFIYYMIKGLVTANKNILMGSIVYMGLFFLFIFIFYGWLLPALGVHRSVPAREGIITEAYFYVPLMLLWVLYNVKEICTKEKGQPIGNIIKKRQEDFTHQILFLMAILISPFIVLWLV